MNLWWFCWIRI